MQSQDIRAFVKEQISYLKNREIAPDDIPDDQPLAVDEEEGEPVASLELDSLDQVELALAIETQYNIGTPEDIDLRQFRSVNDIVDFVITALGEGGDEAT